MDLNASPLPEEDDMAEILKGHMEEEEEESTEEEERTESAVETLRREREERRNKMKRVYPDEGLERVGVVHQTEKDHPSSHSRNRRYDNPDRYKLPHGWLDCPAYGKVISNFIIPSKVPLGEAFNDYVPTGKRYSLRDVFYKQRNLGREIGLVIDLTNTSRYYPPLDLKKEGVGHVKIACKGRDSVPDNEAVNLFVYEVLQFFRHHQDQYSKSKHILVHCTHGHNRTGYMIVHFLMRAQYSASVTAALEIFSNARPPGIYKQDYIDSLYEFYHEIKPISVTCPPTPEWKGSSSDLDLNGDQDAALRSQDNDGCMNSPLTENRMRNEIMMTNDDILGDPVPYEQQKELHMCCCFLMNEKLQQFPGSHPVSLDRKNLQMLRQKYYYGTWKADGTRYMMLINSDGCYLIDRKFTFRRIQMRFPLKQSINEHGIAKETHNGTLLDGEMVIDTLPDTHKQDRRYLIYDIIAINQKPIKDWPFCERWKLIGKEVIEPRNIERQSRDLCYRYDMESFRVRRKDFWMLSTITKLLKDFIPKLSHEADGLIFQGWEDAYVLGTHNGLLKWKYPEMNTVDFLFELVDEKHQLLSLVERGKKKLMEGSRVVFKDVEDPSEYSGKIIECSWDSEEQVWVFMRIRPDKSLPNGFNTYRKVMGSIKDNITEEILLNEVGEIVRLPMYADRIREETSRAHGHHRQHSNSRGRTANS